MIEDSSEQARQALDAAVNELKELYRQWPDQQAKVLNLFKTGPGEALQQLETLRDPVTRASAIPKDIRPEVIQKVGEIADISAHSPPAYVGDQQLWLEHVFDRTGSQSIRVEIAEIAAKTVRAIQNQNPEVGVAAAEEIGSAIEQASGTSAPMVVQPT